MRKLISLILFFPAFMHLATAQAKKDISVIAYYSGNSSEADSFAVEKLTHIIFSFCHLQGNQLHVDDANDSALIQKLVSLKGRNPRLKVLLSLGGWGGCASCSAVFSTPEGRKQFARSVKDLSQYFATDGIDLDWEYPVISGYPGHQHLPSDKKNFTALVKTLRKELGKNLEISFAAGGFSSFINESVEWKKVMKKADRVHLMTYDLVHGFSPHTGHHTPLYSTAAQKESVDNAVNQLVAKKVPRNKIIIGAAFYGREWKSVPDTNLGRYQPGVFETSVSYKNFDRAFLSNPDFIYHWDEEASAPFLYNARSHEYVTYDDTRSISLKTRYAIEKGLGGIMFWQLTGDLYSGGLLDAIAKERAKNGLY